MDASNLRGANSRDWHRRIRPTRRIAGRAAPVYASFDSARSGAPGRIWFRDHHVVTVVIASELFDFDSHDKCRYKHFFIFQNEHNLPMPCDNELSKPSDRANWFLTLCTALHFNFISHFTHYGHFSAPIKN